MPGKRNLDKPAYVHALVNSYFAAETDDTRQSIIDSMIKPQPDGLDDEENEKPEDVLSVIECLSKSDAVEFRNLKEKAQRAIRSSGNSAVVNRTHPEIKTLLPPGALVTRYRTTKYYEGSHKQFLPNRSFGRRWAGPLATRTELDALIELVNILWEIDADKNPAHNADNWPTVRRIKEVLLIVKDADAAGVKGKGKAKKGKGK